MRILRVIPMLAARAGGPAVGVVESSLALAGLGAEVRIVATDLAGAPGFRVSERARVHDLPRGAADLDVTLVPTRLLHRFAYAPAMRRFLRQAVASSDIVHIHMLFLYPAFAAFREVMRLGKPYVVSPHGALDPYLRPRSKRPKKLVEVAWQRRMLNRANALVFTTAEEQALVSDMCYRAPGRVVPNGIHVSHFESRRDVAAFRAEYGLGDSPLIVYLGRISHKKGLDVLINAAATLATRFEFTVVIAGPDDEALTERLAAQARANGILERIRFIGMIRGDMRVAAYQAADAWVLPSHTENFGVAVVEALASGAPVIISDRVNLAREVQQAQAGIITPVDAAAVGAAIERLLTDASERQRLQAAGRKLARRFDWSVVAPQLQEIYAEAIAEGATG